MVEVYKIIVQVYLKRLVKVPLKKLNKRWSTNVGQTVQEDATSLHNTISTLVRAAALMKPDFKRPTLITMHPPPLRFLGSNLST